MYILLRICGMYKRLNPGGQRCALREAAKQKFFFSGPATKRGGVKAGPLRKKNEKKCNH